jgi:hypothetical protein
VPDSCRLEFGAYAATKGHSVFDNRDTCLLLGIAKRTLARYRQKVIRYYIIREHV